MADLLFRHPKLSFHIVLLLYNFSTSLLLTAVYSGSHGRFNAWLLLLWQFYHCLPIQAAYYIAFRRSKPNKYRFVFSTGAALLGMICCTLSAILRAYTGCVILPCEKLPVLHSILAFPSLCLYLSINHIP